VKPYVIILEDELCLEVCLLLFSLLFPRCLILVQCPETYPEDAMLREPCRRKSEYPPAASIVKVLGGSVWSEK